MGDQVNLTKAQEQRGPRADYRSESQRLLMRFNMSLSKTRFSTALCSMALVPFVALRAVLGLPRPLGAVLGLLGPRKAI